MNVEEAEAWVRGERSHTNTLHGLVADPAERFVAIQQADAASVQEAATILRARRDGLLEDTHPDDDDPDDPDDDPVALRRRLERTERELDSALSERDDWERRADVAFAGLRTREAAPEHIARLEGERDEARRERDEALVALGRAQGGWDAERVGCETAVARRDAVEAEVRELRLHMSATRSEREARLQGKYDETRGQLEILLEREGDAVRELTEVQAQLAGQREAAELAGREVASLRTGIAAAEAGHRQALDNPTAKLGETLWIAYDGHLMHYVVKGIGSKSGEPYVTLTLEPLWLRRGVEVSVGDRAAWILTPKWQHDCDRCKFLGHTLGHDIYACVQSTLMAEQRPGSRVPVGMATLVGRWSDEGPDYSSGHKVFLAPGVTLIADSAADIVKLIDGEDARA